MSGFLGSFKLDRYLLLLDAKCRCLSSDGQQALVAVVVAFWCTSLLLLPGLRGLEIRRRMCWGRSMMKRAAAVLEDVVLPPHRWVAIGYRHHD